MRKIIIAKVIGLVAGLLDLIPLVMVGAPLLNMASIAVFWVITSIFVAHVTLLRNSLLNGLVLSTLNMLPLVIFIPSIQRIFCQCFQWR